jgi:hypothetical protein
MGRLLYTAASTAFIAKVRHNRVALWGGGAPGGAATGSPAGGGGGGGGQFFAGMVPLVPGTSYTVTVGQAVTGTVTTNGVAGNDTSLNTTPTACLAKGGIGGVLCSASNTSTAGGVGTTSGGLNPYVGNTLVAGSDGATGSLGTSAGGGGEGSGYNPSGVPTQGAAGFLNNGGTGTTDGGDGGAAGASGGTGGAGVSGTAPGGGGGGGRAGSGTDRAPGNGAAGQAQIDWLPPCSSMLLGVGI